jgi:formamidopyrimidine-DNA glycosylase
VPELPEVRAHAERLQRSFAGAVLEQVRALSFTVLKTPDPSPDAAEGTALRSVRTRGKLLVVDFEAVSFVVHLMQGGRLRLDPTQAARPRGGLLRWRFADGRALLLTEAGTDHRAGVWVRRGDPFEQEPLDHLGPDADVVTLDELRSRLAAVPSMRLHGFLRDQHHIAGLGRRLANEVCWAARLSPFTPTGSMPQPAVAGLHEAIRQCIEQSLALERTRDDMTSSKERAGEVHHRTGEACTRCGDAIRAIEYRSYTINYCATCQTGGKILADNTTSRFLK